jgi:hypothetical protein
VVALAITKLAFEGPPIILKGFSAYICGGDDDLAQLELKNQRLLPLPARPPEFHDHCFCQISLVILAGIMSSSGGNDGGGSNTTASNNN